MKTTDYGRADLHIHTTASDGVNTVREVLDHVAQHSQLDVIAITDHDRVDAALWAYERRNEYPFDIIVGTEVTTQIGHVLGLWVTEAIPPRMSLEQAVAAIHEQGGLAILAHPYHIQMGTIRRNCMRYTSDPQWLVDCGLDGIETHNAGGSVPGANALARRLARRLGLAAVGNSDAHTRGAIGSGQTRFVGHTAQDLRLAITQRQTLTEGSTWPLTDYWNYWKNSTHNTSSEFLAENLSSTHPTQM